VEKERVKNIMQGVSIDVLGDIGGLLSSVVAFIILVGGYVFVVEKRPIRSDYMFYFFIFNMTILTGVVVAWFYKKDRTISTA
jgi:hypothetical protein